MFAGLARKAAPARTPAAAEDDDGLDLDDSFLGGIKQDLGAFESAVATPPKRKSRWKGMLLGLLSLLVILGGLGAALIYLPVEHLVSEYLLFAADRFARTADGDIRASGPIPPSVIQRPSALMQPPAEGGTETSLARRPWLAESTPAASAPTPAPAAPSKSDLAKRPATGAGPSAASPSSAQAASSPPAPAQVAAATTPKGPPVDPQRPAPVPNAELVTFAKLPAWKGERKPLRAEPNKALHVRSDRGTLPIVANGREGWKTYSRPFENPGNKPKVAVLVIGLGLAKDATEAAIMALPSEVSLAFSPYAAGLQGLVTRAWLVGHEVLFMLPGETDRFPHADPGPLGILSGISIEENVERLERVLGKAPGAIGVTSYGLQGNPTFQGAKHLAPLFQVMKDRGMAYLGPGARNGVPNAEAFTFADERLFKASIDARLAQAVDAAKKDGQALIVLGARAASFDRVLAWIPGLQQAGVVLAPASALIKTQGNS